MMESSTQRNDHHNNQSLVVRHSTSSTSTSQARNVSSTSTSAAIVDITNNIDGVWKRLIWAKFHNNGEYWWPSLVFQNALELDKALGETLYLPENTKAKCKLGIAMLTGNSDQSYVLYLGRPLSDLSEIQDHTYLDFVRGMSQNLTTMSLQPNSFHNDQPLYFDWHTGLDEAMDIMRVGLGETSPPTEKPTWLHRAKNAWGNIPGSPGAGASIAAVSMLTDDSYIGGTPTRHNRHHHHDNQKTRRNGDGYDDDNDDEGRKASAAPQNHEKSQEREQQDANEDEQVKEGAATAATSSAKEQQQQESNAPPLFTSPIESNEAWEGVWNKLVFSDWTVALDDDDNKLYFPPGKSDGMSFEEVQEYAEKHYGWKRRPKTAADGGQQSQGGGTFAAEIEAAATATATTTARNRTAGTTAATNRRSSRTTTARTKNDTEMSEEEDRKKHRQTTFGVLWTRISDKGLPEAQRWRMEKAPAKNKFLIDYFFVRPGCSTQNGILGEDYFVSTDDVLEWCTNHNEGMTSSSSDDSTPKHRQHHHHGSSDEDETTAHPHDTTEESEQDDDDEEEEESSPEKTEEEDSFHTGRQDEEETDNDEKTHDSKLLMTPTGCKTTPQDPGKPLLRSPLTSSSESSGSESDFYAWGPLWRYLKVHGWTWMKAKNQFDNFWYIRPGRKPKVKSGMGEQGEDYFANEGAVIAWCKKWDLKDNERSSKKKNKSKKDPSLLKQEAVSKKRQGTDAARPTKRSKNDNVAAAAAASSSSNRNSTKPTTAIPKPTTAGSKKGPSSLSNKKPASKPIVAKKEVDDRPRPWVTRPFPSQLWNIAREAICAEYKSGCYFLTLSDGSSHRVQNLPEVQAYCCKNDNYKFLPDASQYVRDEFVRWANYAFVPGQFDEWRRVPCLSRNQAVVLIKKLGHTNKKRKGGGDTVWSPATSVARALKEQYDSLSGLCRDLRRMEDLECYGKLRKRNFQAILNPKETMELRLWLAESLFDHTEDSSKDDRCSTSTTNIENDRDAVRNKKTVPVIQETDKKRAKTSDTNKKSSYSSPIDLAGDAKKPEKSAANKEKKGFSSPIDFMSDGEYSTSHLSPTEMTLEDAKRVVENLTVKVNPIANTAPWANPPAIFDLFKRIQPLGVTFSGSSYKIPDRPDLSFTSSNEVVNYWAANGNKRNLIGLKCSTDRKDIGRLMDYANVPFNRAEWMTVRLLNVQEACCLLMVLGYICHQDKSWTVPDGLVGLNETHYDTLQELCWALRQVPSLVPPVVKSSGRESSGRASRSKLIKSSAIHDKHLLALRLFIAEEFCIDCSDEEEELSDDHDTVTTASPSANAKKSDISAVTTEKNHARDNSSAAAASVSMEVNQSSAVAPPKTSTDNKHTKATTFVEEQKRTSAKCFDMVEGVASMSTLKRKSDSEDSFSSTKQLPVDESTKTDEAMAGAGEERSSSSKHSPASNPEGQTNEGLVAMTDEKGNDKSSSSQQLLGVEKREESTEAQAVHEDSVAMPAENDNDKSFASKHPQAEETPVDSTKMNELGKNEDLVAMTAENDSDTSSKHLQASEESKMTKQGAEEDLVARAKDSKDESSSSKKLEAPEESTQLTKTNATEEDLFATATEDGNEKSSSAGDNPEEPKMAEKGAEKNLKNEDSVAMALEDDKSSSPSKDVEEGDNPEESTKMTQTEHVGCVAFPAPDGNEARNLSSTRYEAVATPMESSAIAHPQPRDGEAKSMQMPMEVDDESPAASLSASSKSNGAPIETSMPSPDKTTEPEESQTKTRPTGNDGSCDNIGSSATSCSQKVSETLEAGENVPSNANRTDVEFRFEKTSSETASGEGAESKTQKVSTTTANDEFTQEGLDPMQVEKGEQENMMPKGQISMPSNDDLPHSYFGDTSKPSRRDEDVVDDAMAFNDQRGGIALFTQPEDDDDETPMAEERGWGLQITQPPYESDEDFF